MDEIEKGLFVILNFLENVSNLYHVTNSTLMAVKLFDQIILTMKSFVEWRMGFSRNCYSRFIREEWDPKLVERIKSIPNLP